ncbi:MAG: hypothetical protein Q8P20_07910 [bacterium]|nr:hypothetical protein [bacterium]
MLKKRAGLLIILGLFIIGLMGIANATITITFTEPTTSGHIYTGSSDVLNATVTISNWQENVTNITWSYSTDGSTFNVINQLNYSATLNFTTLNISFDTTTVSDSSDIDFRLFVEGHNRTNVTSTITGLRLDNTAPSTASCALQHGLNLPLSSQVRIDLSGSADASDTLLTANVTAYRGNGIEIAETDFQINDTTSIVTLSNLGSPGRYIISCQLLDELGQSTFASNQTITKTSSGSSEDEFDSTVDLNGLGSETQKKQDRLVKTIIGASFLVLVGGMIVIMLSGKGKKRRR